MNENEIKKIKRIKKKEVEMEMRQRRLKVCITCVSEEENKNNGTEYKTLIQETVPEINEPNLHNERAQGGT